MLCRDLGDGDLPRIIKPQLIRSATGTAANYRAACRCRSSREFASRLAVSTEEAKQTVKTLRSEAGQLRAIFSRSRSTALENATKASSARKTE